MKRWGGGSGAGQGSQIAVPKAKKQASRHPFDVKSCQIVKQVKPFSFKKTAFIVGLFRVIFPDCLSWHVEQTWICGLR